jgi:hypothetical protein
LIIQFNNQKNTILLAQFNNQKNTILLAQFNNPIKNRRKDK